MPSREASLFFSALLTLFACHAEQTESAAPQGPLTGSSLRRLSTVELERAASTLLGKPLKLDEALPPDARQHDFSRNAEAAFDSISLQAIYDAGIELDPATLGVPTRLDELTRAAFGRAPTAQESRDLQDLFAAGSEGADYGSGIALVLRALLGSTGFLYESSLGDVAEGGLRRLAPVELARSLSWLIAGQPPDALLLDAAERGELNEPAGRRAQAARLLSSDGARLQYRRFVDEWLGVYRLDGLAKSPEIEPNFADIVPTLRAQTHALVDAALVQDGGRLETLLSGVAGQAGFLQQRSFLSVFAHERESAPVLRGKAVLERLLCRKLPTPAELGLEVTQPPLDGTLTTRERFARHTAEPSCRGCHDTLDAVGFTFEGFDAVGNPRTSDAGKPVDSSGAIDLDGARLELADSTALSHALATSSEARACTARQVVRFALGRTDSELEAAFLDRLTADKRGTIVELFVAFVESDTFAWRREVSP